ncbi:MAG TPA: hypothetical protein VHW23_37310 [Kofleriaceae bacterium]|nr:hypothetical protein [Kofleriaceae bacterium]
MQTRVANQTIAAGDRVDARCTVLEANGNPALDDKGNAVTDSTDFAITYEATDSFARDSDDQVIAARAGNAVVRCSAPSLGLVDANPVNLTIVAGPPARVVTELESPVAVAGQPVGATCLAFDAFDNPVTGASQALAMSPLANGVETTADSVTATLTGSYQVSCVISGAADVTADFLVVVPALPSTLVAVVSPERQLYAIDDQVTFVAEAHDQFGNRIDDVAMSYGSSPSVPEPSEAQFRFTQDGTYTLSATVMSPTQDARPLTTTHTALVSSAGPAITCMRADAPSTPSDAYMLQAAPSTINVPVRISSTFSVQSVMINGTPATLNPTTGNYQAAVPVGFGMTFVDVVATDQFGKENSTTCTVLAAQTFTPETANLAGAIGMRLDPNAIGDAQPTGLNSINDILHTVLSSTQLRGLVDGGLRAANPISSGDCGVFACSPNVNYNANTIAWDTPSNTLALVPGGLQAHVTLPNVRLSVNACGTTCCIGGSTVTVRATTISATIAFSLALQGGVLRAALASSPSVTVGSVSLDGSGFCGFLVNLLQSFFTDTVSNAVHNALTSFINSSVAPLLDQLVSSLDINTLGKSFSVPRLDGTGAIPLQFGLAFSSFDITTARALLGIGTKFTAGTVAQNRPSLGIPGRTAAPLLDPPTTTAAAPVGLALYEGVLNQVLHGLWRGGFFQANLQLAGATATIDAELPPVAAINGNQAQLMLGGILGTIKIPGFIDTPIPIEFGGLANASVTLSGNALNFGSLTLSKLFVSFQASLTQAQRSAMEGFLTQILQTVLVDAITGGLPAFPIPTFALPASAAGFGLPAGAQLGIFQPTLSTSGPHYVLTGAFGVRN